MKKMLACIICLVSSLVCHAQQDAPLPMVPTATDYLQKSKRQKTAAWVLTSAGTAGLVVTLAADMSQSLGGALVTVVSAGTVEPEYKSYTASYLLSGAAIIGGISFFIAAAKNKDRARAATVYIKLEHADLLRQTGYVRQTFPAMNLCIPLNRRG